MNIVCLAIVRHDVVPRKDELKAYMQWKDELKAYMQWKDELKAYT